MTDEQRERRVYHHLYVDSKSPLENAERITDLEELVADLYRFADFGCEQRESCEGCPMFGDEYDELCGMSAAYRRIGELEVPL